MVGPSVLTFGHRTTTTRQRRPAPHGLLNSTPDRPSCTCAGKLRSLHRSLAGHLGKERTDGRRGDRDPSRPGRTCPAARSLQYLLAPHCLKERATAGRNSRSVRTASSKSQLRVQGITPGESAGRRPAALLKFRGMKRSSKFFSAPVKSTCVFDPYTYMSVGGAFKNLNLSPPAELRTCTYHVR